MLFLKQGQPWSQQGTRHSTMLPFIARQGSFHWKDPLESLESLSSSCLSKLWGSLEWLQSLQSLDSPGLESRENGLLWKDFFSKRPFSNANRRLGDEVSHGMKHAPRSWATQPCGPVNLSLSLSLSLCFVFTVTQPDWGVVRDLRSIYDSQEWGFGVGREGGGGLLWNDSNQNSSSYVEQPCSKNGHLMWNG